jgi:hypothetical protein
VSHYWIDIFLQQQKGTARVIFLFDVALRFLPCAGLLPTRLRFARCTSEERLPPLLHDSTQNFCHPSASCLWHQPMRSPFLPIIGESLSSSETQNLLSQLHHCIHGVSWKKIQKWLVLWNYILHIVLWWPLSASVISILHIAHEHVVIRVNTSFSQLEHAQTKKWCLEEFGLVVKIKMMAWECLVGLCTMYIVCHVLGLFSYLCFI